MVHAYILVHAIVCAKCVWVMRIIHVCMYGCMYVFMYACMYVYMFMNVNIYIYIYIVASDLHVQAL